MEFQDFLTYEQAEAINLAITSYRNNVGGHQSFISSLIDSDTGPGRAKFYQALLDKSESLFQKTVIAHSILNHPGSTTLKEYVAKGLGYGSVEHAQKELNTMMKNFFSINPEIDKAEFPEKIDLYSRQLQELSNMGTDSLRSGIAVLKGIDEVENKVIPTLGPDSPAIF